MVSKWICAAVGHGLDTIRMMRQSVDGCPTVTLVLLCIPKFLAIRDLWETLSLTSWIEEFTMIILPFCSIGGILGVLNLLRKLLTILQ